MMFYTKIQSCTLASVMYLWFTMFLCDVLMLKNFHSKTFNVNQAWMITLIRNVVICIQHASVLQLIARDVDDTYQVLGLLHSGGLTMSAHFYYCCGNFNLLCRSEEALFSYVYSWVQFEASLE